jgi:chromosome segregation ATPase
LKKSSPEQKRENYTQQIIQKENQIDDLTDDKRKLEHVILDLDHDIQRGFQQLGELNQEQARYGGSESLWQLQKNEEQLRLFRQTLQEANEEIISMYQKEVVKLDNEKEKLYKERSEIPWD